VNSKFFECNDFEFQTVGSQAEIFIAKLSPIERAKLYVACESIAACFADNSPPVRSRLVKGAKLHELFAILVDWPGGSGSLLRLLGVRDGRRILVARGVRARGGSIPPGEIGKAERTLDEYRSCGDERKGGPA
jgi:hypothetical protein